MLVITRRRGEKITIGRNVEVTVLEIRAGSVRLGITAPQTVPVRRKAASGERSEKPSICWRQTVS